MIVVQERPATEDWRTISVASDGAEERRVVFPFIISRKVGIFMPLSLHEYHERWQQDELWWDGIELTDGTCMFFETGDSPMAEGWYTLPDFGHVICFYRYYREPSKPEPAQADLTDLAAVAPGLVFIHELYGQFRPAPPTDDEFETSWAATAQALDTLLAEFVELGYKPEMSDRLREIVKASLIGFWLEEVLILPSDLEDALSSVGNPLVDYDAYEDEEEARANAQTFNWNNPAHRAALRERIWSCYC